MSITTSKEELEQARTNVAEEDRGQLQKDLEYWFVAKVDHAAAFTALTEQRFRVGELYKEADAWVDLIAEELHRRRHRELES